MSTATPDSNKPKLTWVMPVYNGVGWMEESIQSLLMQTIVKKTEIIIVNDGSNDGTKEFLDEWATQFHEVKVIHNETNQKAGRSRNIGMEAAQAEIIGVCDADDINLAERGELILAHFKEHPESELVNYPYQQVGYFNERIEDFAGAPFDYEAYKNGGDVYFCNPTVAYKKASAMEIGGYEPENDQETDDLQFLRKWIKAGKKVDFVPGDMVILHRILPDSMMVKHRGFSADWVTAKK